LVEVGLVADGPAQAADAIPTRYDIEPNRWIESADKSVTSLADTAAGNASDPREIAMAIRAHVFRWLDKTESDQVLATASQAADGRKGDCSEHAMLTAAACRARGIPARVAIGLIYDDATQSMVYHMWTEVWIENAWLPIDATRPHAEFVASRLKLSDSNLHGASDFGIVAPLIRVAGRLEIEPLSVEPMRDRDR
jgi:transglutaminase-like putative cysteine protease